MRATTKGVVRTLLALLIAGALAVVLLGCGEQTAGNETTGGQSAGESAAVGQPTPTKAESAVLTGQHQAKPSAQAERDAVAAAAGSNEFGFDLFGALRPEGKNFVCSPYVISTVLAEAMAGAHGATREQFAHVLHLDLPEDSIFPALGALDRSLAGVDDLTSASSLWGQTGLKYKQTFVDLLGSTYGAPLRLVDFGDYRAAAEVINRWMSDTTKGRIPRAVDPDGPRPDTIVLMLTSAAYMKAKWEEPFPLSMTSDADFHLPDGTVVRVPAMNQVPDELSYMSDAALQAVKLPYRDGRLSFVLVLPEEGQFADVGRALNSDRLEQILGALTTSRKVTLHLPRFTFRSSSDLVPALQTLGLGSAFSSAADFSGISDSPSVISGAGQEAFILVDETGTEAAASATVTMAAGVSLDDVYLNVDRPFYFLIRDDTTGVVLFMGQVVDPRGDAQP